MKKLHIILLLLSLVLAMASSASACLWDRDTLQQEQEGIEDVISVVLGAFPRNPYRYYEMRREAALEVIESKPNTLEALDAFDNAGVASDRIGESDRAIELMLDKAEMMKTMGYDPSKVGQPNHSYRQKANLGTFYAHRWFKKGKDFSKLDDLNKAKALIAEAIEENPNAHFGREKYQLVLLEWLASDPSATAPKFDEYGNAQSPYPLPLRALKEAGGAITGDEESSKKAAKEALHGLAGLMKMGAAWESIDVLMMMRELASTLGHAHVYEFINQRIEELEELGRKPLLPTMSTEADQANGAKPNASRWRRFYPRSDPEAFRKTHFAKGRQIVEGWHQNRGNYLVARLTKGQHPDTNADFWSGFKNPHGFVYTFEKDGRVSTKAKTADGGVEESEEASTGMGLSWVTFAIIGALTGGLLVMALGFAMRRRED